MKTMKKILCITVVLSIMCTASACSLFANKERKLKDTTDEFMTKLKEFDLKAMNDMTTSKKAFKEEDLKPKGNNAAENAMFDALMSYLKDSASKVKYEIKDVDKDKLKVKISCEYIDSTEVFTKFITELSTAVGKEMKESKGKLDDKKQEEITKQTAEKVFKESKEKFVKKDIELVYEEKDGKYLLKDKDKSNEDLADVITANLATNFKGALNTTQK